MEQSVNSVSPFFLFLLSTLVLLVKTTFSQADKLSDSALAARVEGRLNESTPRVVLTDEAIQRIGITTVLFQPSIPLSCIIYDTEGKTWVYVEEKQGNYHRHLVTLKRVSGEKSWVVSKFEEDSSIVSIGAAELYGIESGGKK